MMSLRTLGIRLIVVLSTLTGMARAQQPLPAEPIHLDVVVSGQHGGPVAGLPQSAFTLYDNNVPQPITSFKEFGKDAPVRVILVVDAVNVSPIGMAYERDELNKFLLGRDGKLDRPTQLAVLTDTGLQMQGAFTEDGRGLKDSLDPIVTGLRSIPRSTGYYGAEERLDISLNAMRTLLARAAAEPGRKVILWISPGWPLLSGVRTELSGKQQDRIFANVVELSTRLRQANVTLYSVDPIGEGENLQRKFAYQEYLKGIEKPSKTDLGDLALQVLVTQSGGLVLNSSNDISGLLRTAYEDLSDYYELTFQSAPGEHPNEYHKLEVRVAQPGLKIHTRQGYYAQAVLPSQPVPVPNPVAR
jgi:VWFA-related protein